MKTILPFVETEQWRPFLTFTVQGVAQPKGSARAYTYDRNDGSKGARVDHDNKRTRTWERLVKQEAWAALLQLPLRARHVRRGPVVAEIHIWMPPIKKAPKERDGEPSTKPDVDKLARCAIDALTGLVYEDDGQVVLLIARKHYAPTLQVCRLECTIAEKIPEPLLPIEP